MATTEKIGLCTKLSDLTELLDYLRYWQGDLHVEDKDGINQIRVYLVKDEAGNVIAVRID